MIDRRTLIGTGGAVLAATLLPRAASAAPAVETLKVSDKRSTKLVAWRVPEPKATLVFSHGHGSWPERYQLLADHLNAQGYSVLAPLHVDSVQHPDRASFSMQAGFGERIADLTAACALAPAALPLGAVGHSFGTLSALCLAGGLDKVAPMRVARVKAVAGFSSPGALPGLVYPGAYASVATPVLIVTGTADTVPGFVTDPAAHRLAFDTGTVAPRALLTLKDGGHNLVAEDAAAPRYQPPLDLFLRASLLGDAAAAQRLASWKPAVGDSFDVKAA